MAKIGARAKLMILREHAYGVFLDAGADLGDVLLPRRDSPVFAA